MLASAEILVSKALFAFLIFDRHTPSVLLCVGNDNLHLLTSNARQRLRVDLADFEGNTAYAEYDNFAVGYALTQYRLVSLGAYRGTGGQYDVKTSTVLF